VGRGGVGRARLLQRTSPLDQRRGGWRLSGAKQIRRRRSEGDEGEGGPEKIRTHESTTRNTKTTTTTGNPPAPNQTKSEHAGGLTGDRGLTTTTSDGHPQPSHPYPPTPLNYNGFHETCTSIWDHRSLLLLGISPSQPQAAPAARQ
jgi:hypothetical protein